MEKSTGAIVGYATLYPDERWPNVYLLDFFIHPVFAGSAGTLLDAISWPKEKVQCYVDAESTGKLDALSSAGFFKEATFSRQIIRGKKWLDVFVMARQRID